MTLWERLGIHTFGKNTFFSTSTSKENPQALRPKTDLRIGSLDMFS